MLEIMYHTVLFAMRYCLLDKREREREVRLRHSAMCCQPSRVCVRDCMFQRVCELVCGHKSTPTDRQCLCIAS